MTQTLSAPIVENAVFRSDVIALPIDELTVASDTAVVAAARVSTKGSASLGDLTDVEGHVGLINFLMRNRHGTPFEHNNFCFFVEAPIAVFREFHRHRIGWSYNEESGRYKQLEPVFYVPGPDRPLVQVGKPGAYEFVPGTGQQYGVMKDAIEASSLFAYHQYEHQLEEGIAREVARFVLPVNIFTSMYATCNARSLMSFLSLRTKHAYPIATFPSKPMWEIADVAEQMEAVFATRMPVTYDSFVQNGRVAP